MKCTAIQMEFYTVKQIRASARAHAQQDVWIVCFALWTIYWEHQNKSSQIWDITNTKRTNENEASRRKNCRINATKEKKRNERRCSWCVWFGVCIHTFMRACARAFKFFSASQRQFTKRCNQSIVPLPSTFHCWDWNDFVCFIWCCRFIINLMHA